MIVDRYSPEEHSSNGSKPQKTRRVERHFTRRIVAGFLLLAPLLITLWIVLFVFTTVDNLFRGENGLLSFFVRDRPWDVWGIGFVITIAILYLIGSFFSGRRSKAIQDAVLSRVPIVSGIYNVARQATDTLSSPAGHHFNRVVMVEWPRPGVAAMGFAMGRVDGADNGGKTIVAVYIPTVPNPTSGMLAFFPEEDLTDTNVSIQDAMKTVFSGGVVLPEMPAGMLRDGPEAMEKTASPRA